MATDTGSILIRDDRISLRTSAAEKVLLTRAAAYRRLDLTSFILQAALPVAHEVVAQAERISLSDRDAKRVLDALENPPKPTKRLLRAARDKYAD
ncbi:MAG: DUF1778 domain-containing protein [Gammaproteobacteria bacterium]